MHQIHLSKLFSHTGNGLQWFPINYFTSILLQETWCRKYVERHGEISEGFLIDIVFQICWDQHRGRPTSGHEWKASFTSHPFGRIEWDWWQTWCGADRHGWKPSCGNEVKGGIWDPRGHYTYTCCPGAGIADSWPRKHAVKRFPCTQICRACICRTVVWPPAGINGCIHGEADRNYYWKCCVEALQGVSKCG